MLTERGQQYTEETGPEPGEGPLAGPRWLYVWNRDTLGECCCWRGAQRREDSGRAIGQTGSCTSAGKHPWVTRANDELSGFAHGAADALEYPELIKRFGPPGGARQLAVVLNDLIVCDLDNPRALRDFARTIFTVPRNRVLAVSTSPRGYHVWLDCPGWNQRALNIEMAQWLYSWHSTDEGIAGRRGFCFDVRTGFNRYVVWPGQHPARRWISPAEFGEVVRQALIGMPAWRMVPSNPDRPGPWQIDATDPTTAERIFTHTQKDLPDISDLWRSESGMASDMERTWEELERACDRLLKMEPGSGRNNALNQVAYFSGVRAIVAGHPDQDVADKLITVAEQAGTHGVKATTASGLRAGMSLVARQTTAR